MDSKDRTSPLLDTASYFYDLPEGLIAQTPTDQRDGSRLMRLRRPSGGEGAGETSHHIFKDLPSLLRRGDLLVMNDTRVFKARLIGRKLSAQSSDGALCEIFCLPQVDRSLWNALVRPGRKLAVGSRVELLNETGESSGIIISIGDRLDDGLRLIHMPDGADVSALFDKYGRVPLPPYIKNRGVPDERYQTVYSDAQNAHSAAAPTAGLHFTSSLMDKLAAAGIEHTFITLDVGLGTFRPVKERNIRAHKMHTERCRIVEHAAALINTAKKTARRVIAVGTTVTRTLESMTDEGGVVRSGAVDTDIFIYPGYRFKAIDALITNFHLPCSTLLMLAAAFAGYGATMAAYVEAVREQYRFFSFGDAMLIE